MAPPAPGRFLPTRQLGVVAQSTVGRRAVAGDSARLRHFPADRHLKKCAALIKQNCTFAAGKRYPNYPPCSRGNLLTTKAKRVRATSNQASDSRARDEVLRRMLKTRPKPHKRNENWERKISGRLSAENLARMLEGVRLVLIPISFPRPVCHCFR
jgi:hypothetical protein